MDEKAMEAFPAKRLQAFEDAVCCTSETRPAHPDSGQMIYKTDTTKALLWTGSSWNESTGHGKPKGEKNGK